MPVWETLKSPAIVVALAPCIVLGGALLLLARRRLEIQRFERSHRARTEAIEKGSHKARLLHPDIDLSKCIGCGSCVRACPEDGVLDLLYGQAVVVHGARCVGHGRCAEACPTGAIALTLGDLSGRDDLPAITDEFEAVGVPGLYVAGELSGFSLVRTAVSHGNTVAESVARRRTADSTTRVQGVVDLLIVGLGPAGLACALRAQERGLSIQILEQADAIGGTVATYPRRKMVMTQPIQLPQYGKLPRSEYLKEDLVGLWDSLVKKHALPVAFSTKLNSVSRSEDGVFTADTSQGNFRARNVCLALGRRGTPRKLGVPGEDLPKVAYSLLDTESYQGRRIYVVGGGDSAVEAAVGLSEQPGNQVTIANREGDWVRIKSKNESRLRKAEAAGRLQVLVGASTQAIEPEQVVVRVKTAAGSEVLKIPNDDVFIFAGGEPPFKLLKEAGVSFDPAKRPKTPAAVDNSTPLMWAVGTLLVGATGMALWALLNRDYYSSSLALRTLLDKHDYLRPAGAVGLANGMLAVMCFAWNLLYLLRRSRFGNWLPGSLRFWMGTHVFTGLASFLCVFVHAGFLYRMTVGGFAFLSLGIVLIAGIVGRYFYAIVPHAANGREMDLDELRARLAALSTTWDRTSRGLGQGIRERIESLVRKDRWHASLFSRAMEMVMSHVRIRRTLRELRNDPAFEGVPPEEREELFMLAKRAFRLTLQIAHYEEVRAVLSTWRFIHGWLALLMVLFVVTHIITAVRYAKLDWPFPASWIQRPYEVREATP